tara:strand:- start:321 stop:590 length:270 start_codon:yes stop_codon:yes gene_type:complete
MIYIATQVNGKGFSGVTEFCGLADFHNYVSEVLSCCEAQPKARETVGSLCDLLADQGPGFGARWHYRISRRDAISELKISGFNSTSLEV